jgi:hypothetical protein
MNQSRADLGIHNELQKFGIIQSGAIIWSFENMGDGGHCAKCHPPVNSELDDRCTSPSLLVSGSARLTVDVAAIGHTPQIGNSTLSRRTINQSTRGLRNSFRPTKPTFGSA